MELRINSDNLEIVMPLLYRVCSRASLNLRETMLSKVDLRANMMSEPRANKDLRLTLSNKRWRS